ncbi:MAG: efflux RND transporter periplasmic adaptor subunit [Candidatus Hydrogenedentes bacterium]|nr:efflux RND transporter periplasmic adaptor subunit [Candidatus Hydrogenedentota bacterium]
MKKEKSRQEFTNSDVSSIEKGSEMNWRKPILWGIIAGAAIVGGAIGAGASKESPSEPAPAPENVTTAIVKKGPLRQVVQGTGKVASNLDVEIKCRASGEIVKVPFDISDTVKKGDLLLALDPRDQQREVNRAEANLAAAKARLEQSQAVLAVAETQLRADQQEAVAVVYASEARVSDAGAKAERERQLLAKKYSSPEVVETAETNAVQAEQNLKSAQAQIHAIKAQELNLETCRQQIKVNKAQVDASKIALDLAELQLSYTNIYAPIDGVVSARTAQIGNIVASGTSNASGGTAVMVLSDLTHVYVLAAVDESEIGFVQLGQPVSVVADAFPRTPFAGEVNRIGTKGIKVTNVITYEVRVEVTSENKTLLKPEMSTDVTIVIADKPSVLQAPAFAIIAKKDGDFVALKGANGSDEELQPVEVGISDGEATEIVSGLAEGAEVIVQDIESEGRTSRSNSTNGISPAHEAQHRQRMMMRTIGGSAAGRGH